MLTKQGFSSLLIISEITLFFDETQTELAVGLSLTIMLVMYTMYESISKSLPVTAYLKMIDYWLLFCLLVPFTIFMIEIYWFLNMTKNLDSSTKKRELVNESDKPKRDVKMVKMVVPAFTVMLMAAYFFTAVILVFKTTTN